MSDTVNNKNVKDDEIDLLDLFRRMGRGLGNMFRAIGKGILISIVFLFRNWLPLGISIIAGVGLSFLMKTTADPFYTSDLVLRNNAAQISDMITYLNRLHKCCQELNSKAISEALSLDKTTTDNVMDIRANWIIDRNRDGIPDYTDKFNVYDTVNIMMRDRFNIRVKIKESQELANLRNSIISYINSDSLFQQRNRVRLRHNTEMLARIEYDIEQLDSLQKVKYFEETRARQPRDGGQMIFLQEQRTQLVYQDIHTLLRSKQSLDTEMQLYNDIVTVLSDFSVPAERENGLMYYAKVYVPLLFIFTLLVLVIIHWKHKIKEVFQKY